MLDAELELMKVEQENPDQVEEVQKRVNQLRIEAAKAGKLPTSRIPFSRGSRGGGFRGRGGRGRASFVSPHYRGRGRGGPRGGGYVGATTLDRRTTKIVISKFEMEEKDDLLEHLQKFGEITESTQDDSSITIKFKTRREAEIAFNIGKKFKEKQLLMSWFTDTPSDRGQSHHEDQEEQEEHHDQEGDHPDDYTPLDITYLPSGLDDQEGADADLEEVIWSI